MPDVVPLETKLDRIADNLVAVIQALRLMSDMQRQQGEQLATILALLMPQPTDAGRELHDLLAHLTASNTTLIVQVQTLGQAIRNASQALPEQMAEAVTRALMRAEDARR